MPIFPGSCDCLDEGIERTGVKEKVEDGGLFGGVEGGELKGSCYAWTSVTLVYIYSLRGWLQITEG